MISTRIPLAALALTALAACGGGDKPASTDEPAAGAAPAPAAAPAAPAPAAAAATGDTITIKRVTVNSGAAGHFEPAEVKAKRGDVLHVVADGGAPHNVDFTDADNPGAQGLPTAPSAYLTAAGQAVDVPVTFADGTYHFQCDPHVGTGMKGVLTVAG